MMKGVIFLLFLFTIGNQLIAYTPTSNIRIKVLSTEISSLSGQFTFNIKYSFRDSVMLSSMPQITLPTQTWTVTGVPAYRFASNIYSDNDSFTVTLSINYPVTDTPFYPQTISIEQLFENATVYTEAKIYFTPYNTIEIWDLKDFHALKRNWLISTSTTPQRKFISQDSIPASDIPDNFTSSYDWQDDFREIFIEGLAYSIPMMAVDPKVIPDSLLSQGTSKADGCGFWAKRWKGNIIGNIHSLFRNDNTNSNESLPLKGVTVELWEKNDVWFSIKHLEMPTDANGNFNFYLNICRSFEGDNVELFLKIRAENPTYDIKGKSTQFFGQVEFEETAISYWNYNNGNNLTLNFGNISVTKESIKATHLSVLAWDFTNLKSGITLDNGLLLRTDQNYTFTLPNISCGTTFPLLTIAVLNKPTIYFQTGDLNRENILYHEFGHFVMWQLQGKCWIDPISGSFAIHYANEESNSRIAWTEGWANAFEAICDAYFFLIDNEYAREPSINYETRNGNTDYPNIDNGLLSEIYIACALFDLWDGTDNYSHISSGSQPSFRDIGNWDSGKEDNATISFQAICQILINGDPNGSNSQIESIQGFYEQLVKTYSCPDNKKIVDCFTQNRVIADISQYPNTAFTTDVIYNSTTIPFADVIANLGFVSMASYYFTFLQHSDKNILSGSSDDFNYAGLTVNQSGTLSDNLTVKDGATLYFNNNIPVGIVSNNSTDRPVQNSTFYVDLCNNMILTIGDNGYVIIGDATVAAYSHLRVKSGSTLNILGNGTLIINPNSQLIIESGANLQMGIGIKLKIKNNALLSCEPGSTFSCFYGAEIQNTGQILVNGSGWMMFGEGTNYIADNNSLFQLGTNVLVTYQYAANYPQIQLAGANTRIVVLNPTTSISLNSGELFSTNQGGATLGGYIQFPKTSTFIIHSNASVYNFNTRLILGNLHYKQNAQLFLIGDNAALDIRGHLFIADNAEFKFFDTGYIRFDIDYNCCSGNCGWECPNSIHAGANSKMTFKGSGPTDKVLVIGNNTLSSTDADPTTPDVSFFTVENGMVVMENSSSRLSVSTPLKFFHSKITSDDGTNNGHRGLAVWGQDNIDITYSTFENGSRGITAWQTFGSYSLNLIINTFKNCDIGLETIDHGATVNNCTFQQNYYGWKADGMVSNCSTDYLSTSNNGYGIFFANTTAPLLVTYPSMEEDYLGVYYDGTGMLTVGCGNITESWGNSIGVSKGSINLSSSGPVSGGVVNLSTSVNTGYALDLDCVPPSTIYLVNGGNNFSNSIGLPDINGTVSMDINVNSITATGNQWDYYSPQTIPVFGGGYYSLKGCICKGACPFPLDDISPQAYNSAQCPEHIVSGPVNAAMSTPIDFCPNCPQITTTSFNNIKLNDAVKQAKATMGINNSYGDDLAAIQMFYEILTFKLKKKHARFDWLMDFSYTAMKIALSNAFSNGKITPSPTPHIAVQRILAVQDSLIAKAKKDGKISKEIWVTYDKSQIYDVNRQHLKTLETINGISSCVSLDSSQEAFLNHAYKLAYIKYLILNENLEKLAASILLEQDISSFTSSSGINLEEQLIYLDTLSACANDTLAFRPSRFANSYFWNFGNGNTSTAPTPSTVYTTSGFYTVTLITTFSCGSDTFTTTVFVGPPQAGFYTSATTVITGIPVSFINATLPSLAGVEWDFGDGSTSTVLNLIHTYTSAGIYTACLTATLPPHLGGTGGDCGSDTFCLQITVTSSFQKAYGGGSNDNGQNLAITSEGDMLLAGYSTSFGLSGDNIMLVKTDATGTVQWTKVYSGINSEEGNSVVQAGDGGYLLCGRTFSFGAGNSDVIVVKTDASGAIQWAKTFGGAGVDYGRAIRTASNGGYILIGVTASGAIGGSDILIVKIDSSGNTLWQKAYGGTNGELPYYIEPTTGGYIVVGYRHGYLPQREIFLLKIDYSGNVLWMRAYHDGQWNIGQGVDEIKFVNLNDRNATPKTVGYLVAGYTTSYGAGAEDIFAMQTDTIGNIQWVKTYGGTGMEITRSVRQIGGGNYLIGGYTTSFGNGNGDIYMLAIDSTGNLQFSRAFGGGGNDMQLTLATDDIMQFTPDKGIALLSSTNSFGAGGSDMYLVKTNFDDTTGCNVVNNPATITGNATLTSTVVSPSVVNLSLSVSSPSLTETSPSVTETLVCPVPSFSAKKGGNGNEEDNKHTGGGNILLNEILSQGENETGSDTKLHNQSSSSFEVGWSGIVSVYPNPSTGGMNIVYNISTNEKAEFTVYDMIGKKLRQYELPNDKTVYTISDMKLENGIYFYDVFVEQEHVATGMIMLIH